MPPIPGMLLQTPGPPLACTLGAASSWRGSWGGGASLRKGIKLLEGTYLPVGPSPRAAGEDSVAMRRELNFIITLYYLMSVSQAAGDVLMKLELHSL